MPVNSRSKAIMEAIPANMAMTQRAVISSVTSRQPDQEAISDQADVGPNAVGESWRPAMNKVDMITAMVIQPFMPINGACCFKGSGKAMSLSSTRASKSAGAE
mgnify:FL=1